MRKGVSAAILALAMSTMVVGSGVAQADTCPAATTTLADASPRTDTITSGFKSYKVTVPANKAGDVVLWGAGDVDLEVCNPSTDAKVCGSDLHAGSADACTLGGYDLDSKQIPPGTWTVKVIHCWGGRTGCLYQGLVPPNTVVPYAVTFKTV